MNCNCGATKIDGFCLAFVRRWRDGSARPTCPQAEADFSELIKLLRVDDKRKLLLKLYLELLHQQRADDARRLLRRFVNYANMDSVCQTEEVLEELLLCASGADAFDKAEPRGPSMQTFSGGVFYPGSPLPEDFNLVDIAHGLSLTNRFAGQSRFPYSVAQHSMLVAEILIDMEGHDHYGRELVQHAHLHDAAEFICLDMPRPLKMLLPLYSVIEDRVQAALLERFGLDPIDDWGKNIIKRADRIALCIERRDVMPPMPVPLREDEQGYELAATRTGLSVRETDWRTVKRQFLAALEVCGLT